MRCQTIDNETETHSLAYVYLKLNITEQLAKILIDTGAQVNLIKVEVLSFKAIQNINYNVTTLLKGIRGLVKPIGTVSSIINEKECLFFVVKEADIDFRGDAILGLEDLRKCTISFPNKYLKFEDSASIIPLVLEGTNFETKNQIDSFSKEKIKENNKIKTLKEVLDCEDKKCTISRHMVQVDPREKDENIEFKELNCIATNVQDLVAERMLIVKFEDFLKNDYRNGTVNTELAKVDESKVGIIMDYAEGEDEVINTDETEYSENPHLGSLETEDIVEENNMVDKQDMTNTKVKIITAISDSRQESREELICKQIPKLEFHKDLEIESVREICCEFANTFYLPFDQLSYCRGFEHKIPLKINADPISQRNHRLSPAQWTIIDKMVEQLLKDDIICHSTSPWNTPIFLVPKKDGVTDLEKNRMVHGFQKLNSITKQDAYPLPRIEDLMDQLGVARYFSSLDLQSGYHQVLIAKEDREKTAFSTHHGHFEFKRMPFGLTGAPATFQRMMNKVLSGLIGKGCLVYLDDIVVYGKNIEEHNQSLRQVLYRLELANLKVKTKKCQFLRDKISFLGHTITTEGLLPLLDKVEAVIKFPIPKTIKKVQSFHGLANYYRSFIPNFAEIAEPIIKLTRKNAKFEWTNECQDAFDRLKSSLTTAPVLVFPDYDQPFLLTTDASGLALGAVLSQGTINKDRPIAYYSRTLSENERKWSTIEREMLAIVDSVKKFRCYLLGKPFIIYSDHKPLQGALKACNISKRLLLMQNKMIDYEYRIVYKPGKVNQNADALSRIYGDDEEDVYPALAEDTKISRIQILTRAAARKKDEIIKEVVSTSDKCELNASNTDGKRSETTNKKWQQEKYNQAKWLENKEDIQTVLKEFHNSPLGGHQGYEKTLDKIKRQYMWQGLYKDVRKFINECEECQRSKAGNPTKMPMQISDTPSKPFEKVYLDIVGPLPETASGNKYILTFEDDLTKFMECVPLQNMEATTVAKAFVERIICRLSIPEKLITDQGTNFQSQLFRECCKLLKIKKIATTAYHPQSNGSLERSHRPLADYLRIFSQKNENAWDEFLATAMFARNSAIHASTKYTPMELLYGFNPEIPNSIKHSTPLYNYDNYAGILKYKLQESYQAARANLVQSKLVARDVYNRSIRENIYKVGDYVRLRNEAKKGKLDWNWSKPYEVIGINSDVNVTIKIGNKKVRIHNNRLKPVQSSISDEK